MLSTLHFSLLFISQFLVFQVQGDILPFDEWPHGRVALQDVSIHFRYAGSGPPILLVHGNPQHSLTWKTIGPILAQNYTVIAPDNRGTGDSSIPANNDFTSSTASTDLKGILDFLNITRVHVFSHDKGAGLAAALAAQNRDLIARIGFSEYVLPGFLYEEWWTPQSTWSLYSNWQLAFFSVPDAAEHFVRGREREMLSWYFFHASYSGGEAVDQDTLSRYATSISKPGFLRATFGYFATGTVAQDNTFFAETLGQRPLSVPVLALGGEASLAPVSVIEQGWGPVAEDLTAELVPKAGHWIADENPVWVANRLLRFFGEDQSGVPSVDLSWLADRVTLV